MLIEDLGEWFGKGPKGSSSGGGWDRYSTTGKKLGKCGDKKPGEGKPKCLSKAAATKLRAKGGAKEIAKAVKRKKRQDPNPDRSGMPQNVKTESMLDGYVNYIQIALNEIIQEEGFSKLNILLEKNEPTNKKLWASARAAAGRKYKIKNSAYKNGYAVQWYNKRGGGWRTVKESRLTEGYDKHILNNLMVKLSQRPKGSAYSWSQDDIQEVENVLKDAKKKWLDIMNKQYPQQYKQYMAWERSEAMIIRLSSGVLRQNLVPSIKKGPFNFNMPKDKDGYRDIQVDENFYNLLVWREIIKGLEEMLQSASTPAGTNGIYVGLRRLQPFMK